MIYLVIYMCIRTQLIAMTKEKQNKWVLWMVMCIYGAIYRKQPILSNNNKIVFT